MSDTTQAPQNPEKKADQRKIMTPEKLERLRLAREKRAHNQLLREEKRMELAKQMVLASVTPGPGMSTQTIKMLKTSPEEKKLKWDARKEAMIQEMLQKIGEANVLAMKKAKEAKEPETESSESELSGMEEPAAKRPKRSKKPVAPKPAKTKKSSFRTDTSDRAPKRRKPVEPAVYSTSESDSESDVEHENVLQLW